MKKIKITEDQLNRILKEEQEWSGSKPKEEGIVKVTIQLSDGEVESYILPAMDVNNVSNRVEEILNAYIGGDFEILGTNILRGKILK
jgi:hypothetical protein